MYTTIAVLSKPLISSPVKIHHVTKKVNIPSEAMVTLYLWVSYCLSINVRLLYLNQDIPARDQVDLRSTYYKSTDAVIGLSVHCAAFTSINPRLVVVDLGDPTQLTTALHWVEVVSTFIFSSF